MSTILVFKYFPTLLAACNKEIPAGGLYCMPRGLEKNANQVNATPAAVWTSRYGSLVFCPEGEPEPIGGMNEAGLMIEQTPLSGTLYPNPPGLPAIGEQQLVQYLLDTCEDVHEALLRLHNLNIQPADRPAHFLLVDRLGDMAVVEFLNKHMQIYRGSDLPLPVLVNLSYPAALAGKSNSTETRCDVDPGDFCCAQEAFDLAACLWEAFQSAPVHPRRQAFAALDRLAGPETTCQCVYDPAGLCVYLRLADQSERQEIRLDELDFSPDQLPKLITIQ